MFCNSGILGIPLPSVLVLQETSLRYVVMVAKFLDDNKRKIHLQSSQVKRTPQNTINEFIIRKVSPLAVLDFRFISTFLHA